MDNVTAGLERTTTERWDAPSLPLADALEGAAVERRSAWREDGNAPNFAAKTAEALGATAGYIQSRDMHEMIADAEAAARRNPVPSLVAAAALGLILGAFLRRS